MNSSQPSKRMLLLCAAALILTLVGSSAYGINETPHGKKYFIYAPYEFQFDGGGDDFESNVSEQHYTQGKDIREGDDRENPVCRLDKDGSDDDFLGIIRAGKEAGIVLITTHGGRRWGGDPPEWVGTLGVEVYGKGEEGRADAIAAVNAYGYPPSEVYVSSDKKDQYYGVWIKRWFLEDGNHGVRLKTDEEDSDAIVYIAACHGAESLSPFLSNGARVALGPYGEIRIIDHDDAVKAFSESLNGQKGVSKRTVASAKEEAESESTDHSMAGSSNTVLAPAVVDWFPPSNCSDQDCEGFVEFDCAMKENEESDVVTSTGCATIANQTWNNGDDKYKITFDFTDVTAGQQATITVHEDKAVSANNESRLDGNQTDDTNGKGPNRDDFIWHPNCTLLACDPAFVQPDRRDPSGLERARAAYQERKERTE